MIKISSQFIPIRMAIIKQTKQNKIHVIKDVEKRTLVQCWWECRMVSYCRAYYIRSPPPQILFPGIRYTGPSPSLSQGQAQCCLSLNSGLLQFLASVQNYSDKSVTPPCRSQGSPHPLVSMELVSHRPCLFTLFLGVAPRQLCMVYTCSLRL